MLRHQAAVKEGDAALARLLDDEDDEDEFEEEASSVSPARRAEFLAIVSAANDYKPSDEEARRMDEAFERKRRLQAAHPLTISSREYLDAVCPVIEPLTQLAGSATDPLLAAALEAIRRHAHSIAAKARRATSGLVGGDDDDDDLHELLGVQSDSNGCAKLVRLLIAESRDCWALLMTVGPVSADGMPVAMLERLHALDRQIDAYFPRAMEFVRAGFDEPAERTSD